MSNTYVKLDKGAVRDEILNADSTIAECERIAKSHANAEYPNGYHIKSFKGIQRAHVIAFPNTERHPK